MKPDLDAIAYVLTPAERTEAARIAVALERLRRQANDRDQQRTDAMLRGNNARLGVVEGKG